MVYSSKLLLIVFGIICLFGSTIIAVPLVSADDMPPNPDRRITEKMYTYIFANSREEQKSFVASVLTTSSYSHQYKLLNRTYDEIIKILEKHGDILRESNITADMEFPRNHTVMELMALYLENTCFFGELILHMPDISYRILKTVKDWRELILDAIAYTRTFVNILDSKSLELLDLMEQEIDISKRYPYFVNPYRDHVMGIFKNTKRRKKHQSKLKKGPQLSANSQSKLEL